MSQTVSICRTVVYVDEHGDHWPAIVTKVPREGGPDNLVSLFIMREYSNVHLQNIPYRETGDDHSWHWPSRA